MNRCSMQQAASARYQEETRSPFAVTGRRPPVICPKPRRLSPVVAVPYPLQIHPRCSSYQSDLPDSSTRTNPLDTLLAKDREESEAASSPPFFCGSPPGRSANPVIHDARFRDDRPSSPFAQLPQTQPSLAPISTKQSCGHAKFGPMSAAVRIEGFDCLGRERDHQGCNSIAASA